MEHLGKTVTDEARSKRKVAQARVKICKIFIQKLVFRSKKVQHVVLLTHGNVTDNDLSLIHI